MTAEVLIITKTAVTLAADSAATISLRVLGKSKTYNSANKLFSLSKKSSVGIMIFGNSEIMDVPVEIIIKMYRSKTSDKYFKTLKNHYDDFISFLESFFSDDDQLAYIQKITKDIFGTIREEIDTEVKRIIKENESIPEKEVEKINVDTSKQIIDKYYDMFEKEKILEFVDDFEDFNNSFNLLYSQEITKELNEIFDNLNIDIESKNKLAKIINLFFCKDFFGNSTGIVITGFGEEDIFPSMFSFITECVINGKLKRKDYKKYSSEEVKKEGANIFAFAQSDMVDTFTFGIDPKLENFSVEFVDKTFKVYSKRIIEEVSKVIDFGELDSEKVDKLKVNIEEAINEVNNKLNFMDIYQDEVIDFQLREHYVPIRSMVQHLSKFELAEMAEALVNITSLKRRVSIELETVGGPVDVAVISKGDGFIWIKRKHYFDVKFNPHYLNSQNGIDKTSSFNARGESDGI